MDAFAQAQSQTQEQQNKALANQSHALELFRNLDIYRIPALDHCTQIIGFLKALVTNTTYCPPNTPIFKTVQDYINLFSAFTSSLAGSPKTPFQRVPLQPPAAPATPTAGNTALTDATNAYTSYTNLMTTLTGYATKFLPLIHSAIQAVQAGQQAHEKWATGPDMDGRLSSYKNVLATARYLGIYNGPVIASLRRAYPQMSSYMPHPKKIDIQKWKKAAVQITAFQRAYKDYTFPQILYHFTKDWDMFDRYRFKMWYNWNYRTGATKGMKKFALQDSIVDDKVQKFEKKRKMLLSRINLVRKALHELINNALIDTNSSNKIYKLLSMLEYEALGLQSPKLAAARTRKAARTLEKLGFAEGGKLLQSTASEILKPDTFVKTADDKAKSAVEILRELKSEMDMLNYGTHLDTMYHLKKSLEKMGRQTDADAVMKIIREDLDSLDKLNKKLTEIYTSISRIPVALSEKEDRKMQNKTEENPQELVKEQPKVKAPEQDIEVTEKDIPTPRPRTPQRSPAPVPNIEKGIPNV